MPTPATHTPIDHIADHLASQGFAVTPNFLPHTEVVQLHQETLDRWQQEGLHRAGVGKKASVQEGIRGDLVRWLDVDSASDAQHAYLAKLEVLRQIVNSTLYLGLFGFEGHFALYPPGAFYRRHIDQFQSNNQRTLTTILYLNPDWHVEDGGALRLYLENNLAEENMGSCTYLDILPQGGTLVTFLSARFWHEVLPAKRERTSITGWFKTRDTASL